MSDRIQPGERSRIISAMSELDQGGRSPLHYAAARNDVAEAAARIADGDDPNFQDHGGLTPLHLAAQEGALEVGRLLLDNGADVDAVNAEGNTPLFVAVFNSRGRGGVIQLLRARGADPRRENAHGQTPIGLALLIDNYDVAKFFADVP